MKLVKPVVLSFSLLAFASAAAYANEGAKASSGGSSAAGGSTANKQDFSKLDKDGDGFIGRMEAAADADAKSRFEKLDENNDQKLSRQEYQATAGASAGASDKQSGKSAQSQQQQGQMRTSELIGKKVTDSQGKELGEISEVVLDLQGGKVHAAVLEFGGILGMGEKNYAFPISQLKPGKNRNQFTMNIDKQKLENAEGFAKSEWPAMNDEYWGRVGGQASAGRTQSKGQKQAQSQGQGQKQDMALVRASELDGKTVQDKSGQDVGEIKDVIVDLKSGQLRNIVIDVQDAGQANVQAKALTRGTGDTLVLNMSAEQLKSQAKKSGKQAQSQREGADASTGATSRGISSEGATSKGIAGGAAKPDNK